MWVLVDADIFRWFRVRVSFGTPSLLDEILRFLQPFDLSSRMTPEPATASFQIISSPAFTYRFTFHAVSSDSPNHWSSVPFRLMALIITDCTFLTFFFFRKEVKGPTGFVCFHFSNSWHGRHLRLLFWGAWRLVVWWKFAIVLGGGKGGGEFLPN
jgi:hypothetical protein